MAPKTDASLQELPSEAWVPWAQEWIHQSGKELQEKFVGQVLEDAELSQATFELLKLHLFQGTCYQTWVCVCGHPDCVQTRFSHMSSISQLKESN